LLTDTVPPVPAGERALPSAGLRARAGILFADFNHVEALTGSHDTIADNSGSGLAALGGGTASLTASVVTGNSPNCAEIDLRGTYNLEGEATSCNPKPAYDDIVGNPLLGGLQDNGGPTQTQALPALSPARDAVPASTRLCANPDQRGVARQYLYATACDMGAYQYVTGPPVASLAPTPAQGLSFGTHLDGSAATAQSVSVSNTGDRPLGIAKATVTGTGFKLASTTCQSLGATVPLPAGAGCTVAVSFARPRPAPTAAR
jgi:hypothetical protein